MNDSSRTQGLAICIGAALLWFLFVHGLWQHAWWAVALPVFLLLTFVLGLAAWVGWTIATIQVEPEPPEGESGGGDEESGS